MLPPALIIDGHNLIGKLPGFSLREMDDENRLVDLLQVYARVKRKRIEVYFDGAPPGQAGSRTRGTIQIIAVPIGRSADHAIRQRLEELGKQARNTTVVTSDRQVQREARARGAGVISSEEFAADLLRATLGHGGPPGPARPERSDRSGRSADNQVEPPLSDREVQEWMEIFEQKKRKPPKS
mgnify:CR=1 FL=1